MTRAWLQNVNDQLTLCYDANNLTAEEVSSLFNQVSTVQSSLASLRDSLYSTDLNASTTNANLALSNADRSGLSALLNQTIADLGTTRTNLASAQTSLKATQNAQSNDGTALSLAGFDGHHSGNHSDRPGVPEDEEAEGWTDLTRSISFSFRSGTHHRGYQGELRGVHINLLFDHRFECKIMIRSGLSRIRTGDLRRVRASL